MNLSTITRTGMLALLVLAGYAEAKPLAGSRPNIILVMTDDQGMGDLSCMGNQVVKTPKIDRFHDKAVRFTRLSCQPDLCTDAFCDHERARAVQERGDAYHLPT